MNKSLSLVIFTFLLTFVSESALAGVVIGGTRIIYPGEKREVSLQIDNPDKVPYLVQSWVEKKEGQKVPFVLTPPVYRSEPGEKNTLRVVKNSNDLSQTKESLYWVNIKAIPPNTEAEGTNVLQIAIKSRIKLIYRPESLKGKTPEDVTQELKWERTGNKLVVTNPTPYYMNFFNVSLGGQKIEDATYVAPSSTLSFAIPAGVGGNTVKWKLISDFGGIGPEHTSNF
ncbi:fimbrial biogenesis chaperone [Enterobacter hormaechei]|uniref:fimbrial biogenesis chaperone n=1 Tax=Enterobacter hormaechei TaxID=158836 RepID=UPI000BB8693E|nr:molecular chaperone [Enterobacter hormaechei]